MNDEKPDPFAQEPIGFKPDDPMPPLPPLEPRPELSEKSKKRKKQDLGNDPPVFRMKREELHRPRIIISPGIIAAAVAIVVGFVIMGISMANGSFNFIGFMLCCGGFLKLVIALSGYEA